MSIGARAAAWWSAWKWVAILALLLGLSLWGNGCQYKRSVQAEHRAEMAGLKEAAEQSLSLAIEGQKRERIWIAAADTFAGTMAQATKDYERAVLERPLAVQCAPGQARMDAVNKALGRPDASAGRVK